MLNYFSAMNLRLLYTEFRRTWCDECVFAGQCFCRSPTNHLPVRWFYHESHQSFLILFVSLFRLKRLFVGLHKFLKNLAAQSRTQHYKPSCPEDALTDFIASSTLGNTRFLIAVITAFRTLVLTVVNTLSTSLRTLLSIFFSTVCVSTCELLPWVVILV